MDETAVAPRLFHARSCMRARSCSSCLVEKASYIYPSCLYLTIAWALPRRKRQASTKEEMHEEREGAMESAWDRTHERRGTQNNRFEVIRP